MDYLKSQYINQRFLHESQWFLQWFLQRFSRPLHSFYEFDSFLWVGSAGGCSYLCVSIQYNVYVYIKITIYIYTCIYIYIFIYLFIHLISHLLIYSIIYAYHRLIQPAWAGGEAGLAKIMKIMKIMRHDATCWSGTTMVG